MADMDELKDEITKIGGKLDYQGEKQEEMKTTINSLDNLLRGDGRAEGLVAEVRNNSRWRRSAQACKITAEKPCPEP